MTGTFIVREPALIYLMTKRPPGRLETGCPCREPRNEPLNPKEEIRTMTKHMTGTREEWLAARLELLEAEKELTRRGDELARRRQELPWVRIDKDRKSTRLNSSHHVISYAVICRTKKIK